MQKRIWLPTKASRAQTFRSGSDFYANEFAWTVKSLGNGLYRVDCKITYPGIVGSEVPEPEIGTWKEIEHLVENDVEHQFDWLLFLIRVGDVNALQNCGYLPYDLNNIESCDFAQTRIGKRFILIHSFVVNDTDDIANKTEESLAFRATQTIPKSLFNSLDSELKSIELKRKIQESKDILQHCDPSIKAQYFNKIRNAIAEGNALIDDIPLYRRVKYGYPYSDVNIAIQNYESHWKMKLPQWVQLERNATKLALCRLAINEKLPLPSVKP